MVEGKTRGRKWSCLRPAAVRLFCLHEAITGRRGRHSRHASLICIAQAARAP